MPALINSLAGRGLILFLIMPLLLNCASTTDSDAPTEPNRELSQSPVDRLLQQAENLDDEESARLRLQIVASLEQDGDLESALDQALRIETTSVSESLRWETRLTQARLSLLLQMPAQTLELLASLNPEAMTDYPELLRSYHELSGEAYLILGETRLAASRLSQAAVLDTTGDLQSLHDSIWRALISMDSSELAQFANEAESYNLRGWIELARVYQADQFSIRGQLDAVERWRGSWNRHPAAAQMPQTIQNLSLAWEARPRRIALILPLQQTAGIAIQEGFISAYYRALEISPEVPLLDVYDSSNLSSIMGVYQDAVNAGAELVIGPLNKQLVNELHRQDSLPVPTLALNYSDSNALGPVNLWQFGLAPEDEIRQTAELAWNRGHKNAAILTPDSQDYLQLQEEFENLWTARGGRVVTRTSFGSNSDYSEVVTRLLAIDSSEARAARLLNLLPRDDMEFIPRRRRDIDFLFLIANPRQGRQIKPTLAFYFAQDLPVFALPSINDGLRNPEANGDLNGIVFTEAPWILAADGGFKREVESSLRTAQGALQRLRAMGIDSFMLYSRLSQFQNRELNELQGETGKLRPSTNQKFHRQLQVARFTDGLVEQETAASEAGDD